MAPDPYNPQSRNKYSYCFNNPLKYYDPSGNWPKFLDDAVSWVKDKVEVVVEAASEFVSENIDTIQTALDVVGMIPVVGEAFDAVNGAIYTARGDAVNAALSFAACVPVAGNAATGVKLVGKVADKVADAVKFVDKGKDVLNFTRKNFRNNLKVVTGVSDDVVKNMDAHHILPIKYEQDIQKIAPRTNIHNPQYGAWVDRSLHRKYSNQYNIEFSKYLQNSPTSLKSVEQYARILTDMFYR